MAEINWPLVGATVLPNVGGWIGAYFTRKNVKVWYESLKRPDWRPPNAAFAPIWTGLYCGMGYASYLVWRDGGGFDGPARLPLALYGSQLALNWAWSPIFFGAHNIKLGLVTIGVLWVNVAACVATFREVSPTAGLILLPYLGWLSLASALNYVVWRDNPDTPAKRD
ncbi:translocator protein [Bacillus rossius redtenbacheri]|uniref:translocator protein n=1 Tax=Bacillus rossius redtenbacheri TaxID=93214 RepID=UPI002FDDAF41